MAARFCSTGLAAYAWLPCTRGPELAYQSFVSYALHLGLLSWVGTHQWAAFPLPPCRQCEVVLCSPDCAQFQVSTYKSRHVGVSASFCYRRHDWTGWSLKVPEQYTSVQMCSEDRPQTGKQMVICKIIIYSVLCSCWNFQEFYFGTL